MNARGAPEGIGAMHLVDQRADVNCDWRATETALRGTPAPMPGEQAAVPRDDGRRFHDLDGPPPATPYAREQHPKESVGSTEPEPSRRGPLEDSELVVEG